MESKGLSHTRWKCQYYIVIPLEEGKGKKSFTYHRAFSFRFGVGG